MEIWKDIIGYEGLYFISESGKIKNKRGVLRKIQVGKTGYCRVILKKKNKPKQHFVHRLVACAFLENNENKKTVNHKNGIKSDNNLSNLEWATHSENCTHKFKKLNYIHGNSRKIINTKTGEVFNSIREAANKNLIKYTTLQAMLSNINPNKTDLCKM